MTSTGPPAQPSAGRCRPSTTVLLAMVLLVAGCAVGDGGDGSGGGPRVADPRFDGEFAVVEVVAIADGSGTETRFPLTDRPTLEIDATFGGLTVRPGCNTYFGSFSLDESGRASFTVTGGTDLDCGESSNQDEAILAALDEVERWAPSGDGFRFEGETTALDVRGPVG